MHETLKLFYGFDFNLLCKSLVEKLLFFEGEYVTVVMIRCLFSQNLPFRKTYSMIHLSVSHRSLHFKAQCSLSIVLTIGFIQLHSVLTECLPSVVYS